MDNWLLSNELKVNLKDHRLAAQTLCKSKAVGAPGATMKGKGKDKKGKDKANDSPEQGAGEGNGADGSNRTCFRCGAADHWASNCPHKGAGKGKGKDKGDKKGARKGLEKVRAKPQEFVSYILRVCAHIRESLTNALGPISILLP